MVLQRSIVWLAGLFALAALTLDMPVRPQTVSPTASPSALFAPLPGGMTRVVDWSYAINDKLVPWPGDERVFEAKTNATMEKDGYFTRSFWMLEHYGTHLDAPIHFPPGKTPVDQIPPKQFFGMAAVFD